MRVVDWAVRKGLADRDQVGLLGLSYGGYMTNWLLGHHPGRFAAAVSENPVVDLFSFTGESDSASGRRDRAGLETPWDDYRAVFDRSPGGTVPPKQGAAPAPAGGRRLPLPRSTDGSRVHVLRRLGRTVEMVRYPTIPPDCLRRPSRPPSRPPRADRGLVRALPMTVRVTRIGSTGHFGRTRGEGAACL